MVVLINDLLILFFMMPDWSTVKPLHAPLPLPCPPKASAVGHLGIAWRNTGTICFSFLCPATGLLQLEVTTPWKHIFRYLSDLINNRSDFNLAEKWMLQPCFLGFFHDCPLHLEPSLLFTRSSWLGHDPQELITISMPAASSVLVTHSKLWLRQQTLNLMLGRFPLS